MPPVKYLKPRKPVSNNKTAKIEERIIIFLLLAGIGLL